MKGLLAISLDSKLLEFNTIKSEHVLAKKELDIKKKKKAQQTNLLTPSYADVQLVMVR